MPKTSYIIDFDSTIVQLETLDEIIALSLVDDPAKDDKVAEISRITNLGMTGQIGFDEALRRRLETVSLNKSHIAQIIELLASRISPSARRNIAWFEQNRANIYVISGGFEEYIRPTIKLLGLDESQVYANQFTYDYDQVTGYDATRHAAKAGGKSVQVRELDLSGKVVVIGDGYTDYMIKESGAADEFWAFTETVARDNVTAVADRVVASFDEVTS